MVYFYSKQLNQDGVYYSNVTSIIKSFTDREIDIGLTNDDLKDIESQIIAGESSFNGLPFNFCGPYESLFVAYYVYGRRNMQFDRMGNHTYKACEDYASSLKLKTLYLN